MSMAKVRRLARASGAGLASFLLLVASLTRSGNPQVELFNEGTEENKGENAQLSNFVGWSTEPPPGTLPSRPADVHYGTDVYRVHYDDATRVEDVCKLLALLLHLPHAGDAWGLFDASGEEQWEEALFASCALRGLVLLQRAPDSHRVVVAVASHCGDDGVVQPATVWRGRLRCGTPASDLMLRLAPDAHTHALHDASGRRVNAADRLCIQHHRAHQHSVADAAAGAAATLFFDLRPPYESNRVCGVVLEPQQALPLPAAESGVMAAAGRAFATASTPLRDGEDVASATLRFAASRVLTQGVSQGQLVLTPLRLLFDPYDRSTYRDAHDSSVSVALRAIHRLVRLDMGPPLLQLVERSGRVLVFSLPRKRHARGLIVAHWQQYCGLPFALFQCAHLPPPAMPPLHEANWLREQYARDFGAALSGSLRLSDVNAAYAVCASYPSLVVVPAAITDEQVAGCAEFRARNRFPAVVWRHSGSGAVLVRCAQPLVGIASKRSADDEAVVAAVKSFTGSLVLIDSRPMANAVAYKLAGAGSESSFAYGGCEVRYVGLANIHAVRESWQKLLALCVGEGEAAAADDAWFMALHNTQWLQLVRHLLEGATLVARMLDGEGRSCVTHCSDGWDRTSQLCALAQLLLDPFFRTMEGFARLVHKEWLSFGHRFETRAGPGAAAGSAQEREASPVFLLFLDCVHQIVRQFPQEFEFGSSFLVDLYEASLCGEFGTFLFDSERERHEHTVYKRCASAWQSLLERYSARRNADYAPREAPQLFPSTRMCHLALWTRMFLRAPA